ncbi:MAG: primosomal protein N' [Candidatus Moranbacteria bacterium]|nr:primosomal protein N' [Candidatus Moranbacteria bacterium]
MKTTLYRLEIAPLVIIPLDRGFLFSYASSTRVPTGSLVSISFGKRMVSGVVFRSSLFSGPKPEWIKMIHSVIQEKQLTKEQLLLAQYIHEEYYTSMGRVLIHFLSQGKTGRKRKISLKEKTKKTSLPPLTEKTKTFIRTFSRWRNKTAFCDGYVFSNQKDFFLRLFEIIVLRKEQVLLLVPEILLTYEWEEACRAYFGEEHVVLLHSQCGVRHSFEASEKIRSGEARVVVATRQGLFAPFACLGGIFVFEDQDDGYKQWDMSPRYDGRNVAKKLAFFHKALLLMIAGAPSSEHFFFKQQKALWLGPAPSFSPLQSFVELVNMRLERFKKNFSPLSSTLIEHMRVALRNKKQILLYVHRQGMDVLSVCEHCKNILSCPRSGHMLTSDGDGGFRCRACKYHTEAFPSCPVCGHLSFKNVGFGTEKVEREVAKIFPHARIIRADASTLRTGKKIRTFYETFSSQQADILIGTTSLLKGKYLSKCALVGMIDIDSQLSFPDFRVDERLFQILFRCVYQSLIQSEKGKIVIQTFRPESPFFQKLNLTEKSWFEDTLLDRASFVYPPFARFVTFSFIRKTEKQAFEDAEMFRINLEKFFTQYKFPVKISAPQSIKKRFHQKTGTEIKMTARITENALAHKEIRLFLRKNTKDCIIDIDSLST